MDVCVMLTMSPCPPVPRGSTVLAKSVTEERIKENLKLVDLTAEDSRLLDEYSEKLGREGKHERFVYPPFGINFGFPDQPQGVVVEGGKVISKA